VTGTGATIADQTLEELAGRISILARQRADHARLDRLIAQARKTAETGGIAHQVTLRALAQLVFTHAFAEEAVLFPAARRVLLEGDPLTLRIETDHQQVDELVGRLDRSSPTDSGHHELMEQTFAVLDHDVRTEEDELLPRMQELLTQRRLRLLGWQWELVWRISPTRPHPGVSRRPPGQVLSATADRARPRPRPAAAARRGHPLTRQPAAGSRHRSRRPTASWSRLQVPWRGHRCCQGASGPKPADDGSAEPRPFLRATSDGQGLSMGRRCSVESSRYGRDDESSPRPSRLMVGFERLLVELCWSLVLPNEEMMRKWPLTTPGRRPGARTARTRKHRQAGCGKYGTEWQC
jgi:hemerythrin superfamily protein